MTPTAMKNKNSGHRIWLMKSEPDVFSISDLERQKFTLWEGVRNYQARNFMMNDMQIGDAVLFYHSNAEPSGIAGLAEVSAAATADPTQFDKKSEYFDPKASPEKPRWFCVQLKFVRPFSTFLPLAVLRSEPKLTKMPLLMPGTRLSITPVSVQEFKHILKMSEISKETKK
jgi:predicted RNA-binding protein with PUA-like domain